MSLRYFSSTAGQMVLQSSISSSATSITVDTVTGLPGAEPFTIVLDPGTSLEEICDVTAVAGTTLTITRGVDGSPAVAHSTGAFIRHMFSARDLREANAHVNAVSGVHGVTGALVGTTDSQALTNKDLTNGTNVFPSSLATLLGTQAFKNKDLTDATNAFPSSLALTANLNAHTGASSGVHGVTGNVVGTTDTQTLTNKTLNGPVLTGTISTQSTTGGSPNDLSQMTFAQSAAIGAFSGWGNYGNGYQTQEVKLGYDGIVHISGVVLRTDPSFSPTAGTTYVFANLPSWAKPGSSHIFPAATSSGTGMLLIVTSTGALALMWTGAAGTTQPSINQNVWWISIDASYPL